MTVLGLVERLNASAEHDGILVQSPLPESAGRRRRDAGLRCDRAGEGRGRLHAGQRRPVGAGPARARRLHAVRDYRTADQRGRFRLRAAAPASSAAATSSASRWRCCCSTATRPSRFATRRRPISPSVCREADILVAAVGRPGLVTRDFVKPGATVIDVGMNRVTDAAVAARLFPAGSPTPRALSRARGRCSSATCIRKWRKSPAR